jgi:hypothetical protein
MDICNSIKEHMHCPAFTMLSAGDFDLGPVASIRQSHKKLATKN